MNAYPEASCIDHCIVVGGAFTGAVQGSCGSVFIRVLGAVKHAFLVVVVAEVVCGAGLHTLG